MSELSTDIVQAESSPAITLDSLTPSERLTWRETGNFPDRPDAAAESSPAEPDVQAPSMDGHSAASEPATPTRSGKKNAETRVQELLAERARERDRADRAERELAALRQPAQARDAPQAVSSPAPVQSEKFPGYEAWSQQAGHESLDYEEYIDARAAHVYAKEQQATRQREEQAQRATEAQTAVQTYRERAETFVADHGDYWTVIQPVTSARVTPTTDAIGDVITRSDVAPQLLYHLGTHLEQFERLVSLPERLAVYELGKLEATLRPAPSTAPIETPVSTAPAPPATLGSKPSDPGDDAESALKAGDFRAYRAAMNRREMAQKR